MRASSGEFRGSEHLHHIFKLVVVQDGGIQLEENIAKTNTSILLDWPELLVGEPLPRNNHCGRGVGPS